MVKIKIFHNLNLLNLFNIHFYPVPVHSKNSDEINIINN